MMALFASPTVRWALAGLAILALVGALYGLWQGAAADAAEWETKARTEASLRIAADARTAALERASIERAADTQERMAETDQVSDALDRLEQKVETNEPLENGAAARAVTCSRLRRQGQTSTPEYRASCT